MVEYRAGQRVRIEIEGTLERPSIQHGVVLPPDALMFRSDAQFLTAFHYPEGAEGGIVRGAIVTVLSEPRPDEPTGLGAVVEALFRTELFEDDRRRRFVRRPVAVRFGSGQYWVSEDGETFAQWKYLADPVVLSEGWTP